MTKTLHIILLFTLSSFFLSCTKGVVSYKKTPTNYHFLEDGRVRLHFISKGNENNPPLLLIHGAPGTLKDYNNLITDSLLLANFNIIAVDRLGYGLSRKNKNRTLWSIESQANTIVKALNANKSGKKAFVIGRSYGAPIAAKLAAEFPDKVEKLILVSPVIDPEKEKIFWFAYAARHWVVSTFLDNDYNLATDEKMVHRRELRKIDEDWQKIKAEVIVFQGGEDWIADVGNLDFARKKIKSEKKKFILLPKAGHMITETHPDLVKKELFKSP